MTDIEVKIIKTELNQMAAKDKFSNICESALRLINLYEAIILGNQMEIAELKKRIEDLKAEIGLNEVTIQAQLEDRVKVIKEIEKLKKNALVWHKVTCFNKPDENGWITNDVPAYDDKKYLVRTKRGHYSIQELMETDTGVIFEDCEWEDVDEWAELPEV